MEKIAYPPPRPTWLIRQQCAERAKAGSDEAAIILGSNHGDACVARCTRGADERDWLRDYQIIPYLKAVIAGQEVELARHFYDRYEANYYRSFIERIEYFISTVEGEGDHIGWGFNTDQSANPHRYRG